jgi:hypothetical protein
MHSGHVGLTPFAKSSHSHLRHGSQPKPRLGSAWQKGRHMSYDLMFEAGRGKKLDKKTFAAHFRNRRNYKVENGQAVYQNEDTGVYFIFDSHRRIRKARKPHSCAGTNSSRSSARIRSRHKDYRAIGSSSSNGPTPSPLSWPNRANPWANSTESVWTKS